MDEADINAPDAYQRAGVEDRWADLKKPRQDRNEDGTPMIDAAGEPVMTLKPVNHRKGLRWRARYVDENGKEHAKGFGRKADAQNWLNKQVSDQVTGTWTDPALSAVTFGEMAERWIATKAVRAPKTVAGYRSLLDTVVLPRWKDVALRDIKFEDLQVWIAGLSVDGSVRFEGKGLSASRVRQAHQLVGAVLRFTVKVKHLPANPAEGVELPSIPETEQRYLTHEQLHRVAMAAGRTAPSCWSSGIAGSASVRRSR